MDIILSSLTFDNIKYMVEMEKHLILTRIQYNKYNSECQDALKLEKKKTLPHLVAGFIFLTSLKNTTYSSGMPIRVV